MIKKLVIKKFESHRNTTLDFSDGFNMLVGATDAGKSSIIRAMILVIYNKPAGDSYRIYWEGDTIIELYTNNHVIKRVKGKGRNEYWVDKTKFEAFGQGVPKEVSEVLNIEDINIGSQFKPHFLLSSSPGEVAKHFNKVANLSQINSSLQAVKSWISSIKSEIKNLESQQKQKKEQISKFEHIPKFEIEVEVLEQMGHDLSYHKSRVQKLKQTIQIVINLQTEVEKLKHIPELEKKVNIILKSKQDLKQLKLKRNKIYTIIKQIKILRGKLKNLPIYEDTLIHINKILLIYDQRKKLIDQYKKLNSFITSIIHLNNSGIKLKSEIIEEEKLLKKNTPDTCPFCNQPIINQKTHKHD